MLRIMEALSKKVRFDVEEKDPTPSIERKRPSMLEDIKHVTDQLKSLQKRMRWVRSSTPKCPTEHELNTIYAAAKSLSIATMALQEPLNDLMSELECLASFCEDRYLEFQNPGLQFETDGLLTWITPKDDKVPLASETDMAKDL